MELNSTQPSGNTHPVCLPPSSRDICAHTPRKHSIIVVKVVTHPPDDGISEQQEFEANVGASVTVARPVVVGHVVGLRTVDSSGSLSC